MRPLVVGTLLAADVAALARQAAWCPMEGDPAMLRVADQGKAVTIADGAGHDSVILIGTRHAVEFGSGSES